MTAMKSGEKLMRAGIWCFLCAGLAAATGTSFAQNLAVKGETVYTMAGGPIQNGVVLIRDGKIERVGAASQVAIPAGYQTISAKIVTPGLVDAHSTVGLSGLSQRRHRSGSVGT